VAILCTIIHTFFQLLRDQHIVTDYFHPDVVNFFAPIAHCFIVTVSFICKSSGVASSVLHIFGYSGAKVVALHIKKMAAQY
jgi:hypothetical protein